jgi:hypothetical protein
LAVGLAFCASTISQGSRFIEAACTRLVTGFVIGYMALYIVLRTVVTKYRKWSFRHLVKQKPLVRLKRNFVKLIMSAGPINRPKFITIGWGSLLVIQVKLSTGGVSCWQSLFVCARAQPTPSA